jgi:MYXO-CTERM domain-containing protein
MRLAIVLGLVPISLALCHPDAQATGLGASVSSFSSQVRSLGRLDSLSVDVRLGESTAEIIQRRSYTLNNLYAGGPTQLTFYDSVASAGPTTITVNGTAATGTVLAPAEADSVRRQLTQLLGDSAPLRELGTSLYATDAMSAWIADTNIVDVQIATTVPLAALGTMRGLIVPLDWGRQPIGKVDMKVTAASTAPLRALYSPYHELEVVRDGVNAAHASYTGRNVCTDFDLTLLVSSGDGLVHLDMLPFRYGPAEGGYFLALVTPDPTPAISNVLPRDLVFVLDTSGSMSGVKITQAKEALRGVLQGLRPADSFALITFSDAVRSFESAAMVAANADNVAAAVSTIDGLQAAGGTNIYDALNTALGALPRGTGHPRYVVFLTDGQPTVGTTGIDAIATMAHANNVEVGARLFSFGIGNDVNTVLLDRLARDSAGDVIYIRPDQSVAVAVQAFFQQIADPVLSDPTVDLGAFAAADLFPDVMPDLYAGRTVTLFGRFGAPGTAAASLAGSRAGQPWSASFDVTLPDYALEGGYVPRVWALRQVGRLLADIKQGDTNPLLVVQVIALATRFGVTTNFTTFAANAEGDVTLRYAGVPTAQSGSVAVDTSSALRDYGSGDAVQTSSNPAAPTRYAADRTLVSQGGYLTDTKLTGDGVDVELTFASDRYFAFAAAEAPYGAGALLAAGTNVRFELLGRTVRVTDPAALPRSVSEVPPESAVIPDPAWRPIAGATTSVVGTNTTPTGTAPPTPVADRPAPGLTSRAGCACDAGSGPGGRGSPGGLALLAALVLLAARARRRVALLPVVALALASAALGGCDTQPLDPRSATAPDAGGTATTPSVAPSCLGTMAAFTSGLLGDLAGSVSPERRNQYNDTVVEGVSVTAGYGQDLAMFATGFSVGRSWITDLAAAEGELTLSFGGWRSSSGMRDARAFRAAEQLWTALAGASEVRHGATITRTTSARRAGCRHFDTDGTVDFHCSFTGLLNADAAEIACQ